MIKENLYIIFTVCCLGILSAQKNSNDSGAYLNEFQIKEVLDLHNEARSEVGVDPLVWSHELSEIALNWAIHLASSGCTLEHTTTTTTGENLYWTSHGSESTPYDATKTWYSEIKNFKNVELFGTDWYATGHYSQMVWKDTKNMGMAISKCENGGTIVVANYSPPGNYLGEKAY